MKIGQSGVAFSVVLQDQRILIQKTPWGAPQRLLVFLVVLQLKESQLKKVRKLLNGVSDQEKYRNPMIVIAFSAQLCRSEGAGNPRPVCSRMSPARFTLT